MSLTAGQGFIKVMNRTPEKASDNPAVAKNLQSSHLPSAVQFQLS
jgi:hypothetical protein